MAATAEQMYVTRLEQIPEVLGITGEREEKVRNAFPFITTPYGAQVKPREDITLVYWTDQAHPDAYGLVCLVNNARPKPPAVLATPKVLREAFKKILEDERKAQKKAQRPPMPSYKSRKPSTNRTHSPQRTAH